MNKNMRVIFIIGAIFVAIGYIAQKFNDDAKNRFYSGESYDKAGEHAANNTIWPFIGIIVIAIVIYGIYKVLNNKNDSESINNTKQE